MEMAAAVRRLLRKVIAIQNNAWLVSVQSPYGVGR